MPVARLARTKLVPISDSITARTVFAVGTTALTVLQAVLRAAATPACTFWIKPVMSVTAVAMLVEHDAVPPMPAPAMAAAVPRSRVLRRVTRVSVIVVLLLELGLHLRDGLLRLGNVRVDDPEHQHDERREVGMCLHRVQQRAGHAHWAAVGLRHCRQILAVCSHCLGLVLRPGALQL